MSSNKRAEDSAHSGMPAWYQKLTLFSRRSWSRAILQIANTVIPYLLIAGFMVFTREREWPYWITLLLAIPAALFLVRTFIIFHDCTHGSFTPSTLANRVIGFITGVLTFTSFESFRVSHLTHHATNGKLDHRGVGDVYTMTFEEYRDASRWSRFTYRVYRNPVILFVLGPLFTFVITNRWAGVGRTRAHTRSILLTNLGIAVIATTISLVFGFWTYFAVQFPIIMISGSMGIWLFYIQHQFDPGYWARDDKWDRYNAAMHGSSYYKLPTILRWFSGNIGVHHLHHLQPRIPNYRLYRAYKEVPEAKVSSPLTIWSSLKSIKVNLWSEVHERFLTFRQASRLMSGGTDSGMLLLE